MTTCPRCHQPFDDWVYHLSHDPPLGCPVYALALSSTWYPPSMQERGRVNQANVGKRKVSVPGKGIRVRA